MAAAEICQRLKGALVYALGATFAGALPIGFGIFDVELKWAFLGLMAVFLLFVFVRKKTRLRIFVVVCSVVLTVSLLESGLRSFAPSFLLYRPHEVLSVQWPDLPILARYRANSSLEMRAFGDLAAMSGNDVLREFRDVAFETDDRGFRNRNAPTDEPIDIVVLGDSFGVGNGMTQEGTWPNLLSDRLDKRIHNLSMPGSLWQGYANLKIELPRLSLSENPLLIVTVFGGNDLDEWYFNPSLSLDTFPWTDGLETYGVHLRNFRHRSPLRRLTDRLSLGSPLESDVVVGAIPGFGEALFFEPYIERCSRDREELVSHPNYILFKRSLEEVCQLFKAAGGRVAVVVVPSKYEVYYDLVEATWVRQYESPTDAFGTLVAEMSVEFGFETIELKSHLRSLRIDSELLWWRDDTHWNAYGHATVARIIQATPQP